MKHCAVIRVCVSCFWRCLPFYRYRSPDTIVLVFEICACVCERVCMKAAEQYAQLCFDITADAIIQQTTSLLTRLTHTHLPLERKIRVGQECQTHSEHTLTLFLSLTFTHTILRASINAIVVLVRCVCLGVCDSEKSIALYLVH